MYFHRCDWGLIHVVAVIAGVIGIVVVTVVIGVGAGAHAKNDGGERQRHQGGDSPATDAYPQQPPDFFSGFVPAGSARNFCRQ